MQEWGHTVLFFPFSAIYFNITILELDWDNRQKTDEDIEHMTNKINIFDYITMAVFGGGKNLNSPNTE